MRNCWRCSSSYCIGTRLYDFVLGQDYWETAKATSPIILELLLEHLPISVIGKKLLRTAGDALFKILHLPSSSPGLLQFPEVCSFGTVFWSAKGGFPNRRFTNCIFTLEY